MMVGWLDWTPCLYAFFRVFVCENGENFDLFSFFLVLFNVNVNKKEYFI